MYQISGRELIFTWLERESDPECRELFLEWLTDLARDPINDKATRLPGVLAPVYVQIVPLGRGPNSKFVVVRYLVADQFNTVRVMAIGPLP